MTLARRTPLRARKPLKARAEKACTICERPFTPRSGTARTCSPKCAIEDVRRKEADKARRAMKRETRERREAIKTIPQLIAEAQDEFNKWVRERDFYLPCVSCGRFTNEPLTGGAWDCGHYLSRGSHPELRFEPLNAAKQCKRCNGELSGNSGYFRLGLIARIGIDKVNWLEGPHPIPKLERDTLRALRGHYRSAARDLRKARAA